MHEKEANSILTKSGLKHLVSVTPSIDNYKRILNELSENWTQHMQTCQ